MNYMSILGKTKLHRVLESSKRICLAIEYYKKTNTKNKNIYICKLFIVLVVCFVYKYKNIYDILSRYSNNN